MLRPDNNDAQGFRPPLFSLLSCRDCGWKFQTREGRDVHRRWDCPARSRAVNVAAGDGRGDPRTATRHGAHAASAVEDLAAAGAC